MTIQNQLTKADKAWLKKHRAKIHRIDEEHGEDETWIFWQVVRGNQSLSGHPMPTAQGAIRQARAKLAAITAKFPRP